MYMYPWLLLSACSISSRRSKYSTVGYSIPDSVHNMSTTDYLTHPEDNTYNTINTIRYNTIRYNTIRYNTIRYNTIRYNTIRYNPNCLMVFDCGQIFIYHFHTPGAWSRPTTPFVQPLTPFFSPARFVETALIVIKATPLPCRLLRYSDRASTR